MPKISKDAKKAVEAIAKLDFGNGSGTLINSVTAIEEDPQWSSFELNCRLNRGGVWHFDYFGWNNRTHSDFLKKSLAHPDGLS